MANRYRGYLGTWELRTRVASSAIVPHAAETQGASYLALRSRTHDSTIWINAALTLQEACCTSRPSKDAIL
ncbi:hypothetical protein IG631_04527 [Alternaria alternata]|nr:hypothetical protein IG631_04527 [Alternaria alternata]